MTDQQMNISVKSPLPKKASMKGTIFSAMIGITLAVTLIFILLLILNYINILKLSKIIPGLAIFPHQTSSITAPGLLPQDLPPPPTNQCDMGIQKYLELHGVNYHQNGITGGSLIGVIRNITFDQATKTADITVSPLRNSVHSYSFKLVDLNVRMFNDSTQKFINSLSELITGQKITLTYTCNPSNGNKFLITSLNVTN